MKLYVYSAEEKESGKEHEKFINLGKGKGLYANLQDADIKVKLGRGKDLYLYGDIFYYIENGGKIKVIDANSESYLKKVFSERDLKETITRLEGQYLGIYVDSSENFVQLFSDRYARLDSFYANNGNDFYFATGLDFIFKHVSPEYDTKMFAHIFSVYGWYTPKGLTVYKNVKQLRVGEIITLSGAGFCSEMIEFKPQKIEDYDNRDLEVYYKILRESIIARASKKSEIWVSSSSGWDSTMLLAILVDEFGSKKINMSTTSLIYSSGTETINKFEIDKVNKIGKFYDVDLNIVESDYKNKKAGINWEKVLPYYKSKQIYSFNSYGASKQSAHLKKIAGDGVVIFNGETSDSFHNLGFAQFATYFHTNKPFTEYADKMNCYLYGPSFFKKVLDGTYEKDKVFQIFQKMFSGVEFSNGLKKREEIIRGYLFPFFYSSPRIPFAKTYKNPVLLKNGQDAVYSFLVKEFMPEIIESISDKNIYSWLLYLYLSFHAQGSTVNVIKHAMEFNNHKWRMPFNDYRMMEFLSKAPEKWGRGLELNNTKYPLKWVARNKIKFPYELLDEGPHSYLYDVIEGFSLAAEIVYRSGVTEFFKDMVKSRQYGNVLSSEYFDMRYLNKLRSDYLDGKEAKGQDFNNLVSLITLCITGWY